MSEKQIFRQEAIKKVSTPDELDDYLHVTSPSVWVILSVVIVLLIGVFAWATVGDLETTVDVSVTVKGGEAVAYTTGRTTVEIKEGMLLRVDGQETTLEKAAVNEDGWQAGYAHIPLDDNTYTGVIVVETIKPISFLLESR